MIYHSSFQNRQLELSLLEGRELIQLADYIDIVTKIKPIHFYGKIIFKNKINNFASNFSRKYQKCNVFVIIFRRVLCMSEISPVYGRIIVIIYT